MSRKPQEIERFINDRLKSDLRNLEIALNKNNEDLMEYMQLEKTIEFIKTNKPDGFKTQVDIGTNIFMEAQVDKIEPIIVNVGLNVYLELTLEEALKFLVMKIKSINKESDLIREQSLKVKAEIKILLMYLAEERGYFAPTENK